MILINPVSDRTYPASVCLPQANSYDDILKWNSFRITGPLVRRKYRLAADSQIKSQVMENFAGAVGFISVSVICD